ncbi:MAG TPA: chemotaxis-specific protein-glutamate methyltransferase CheB [Desulfuromonadales bacterium]|nr:chemotaxis-specific protein-glutamate methyltransferase CheB [Desulfuromonadales bacterium]
MKKLKILVVDDSAFSRRSITRMLEGMSQVVVVGYATDGEEGIQKAISLKPDLVTLDLEMPKMDGFTLLRILTTRFSLPVIVVSALSGADNVFKALELGALDFVAKPCSNASIELLTITEDLRHKVLQFCVHHADVHKNFPPEKNDSLIRLAGDTAGERTSSEFHLHGFDMVAIGASTGGPPALQQIFSALSRKYPFAICVAQHMPAGFTKPFAERLNRSSAFDVKEAEDGDQVLPGSVLIAPGGKNLLFELYGGQVIARVAAPTESDRYVPSVDVMFGSCAALYRKRLAAVVLTGMGNDGSKGVRDIKQQGGFMIAESEESAVVYGMPREAAATGLVDRVVPLHKVYSELIAQGGFV